MHPLPSPSRLASALRPAARAGFPAQASFRPLLALLPALALAALATSSAAAPLPVSPAPRNVLLILVDDWGWTDAGVLGSDLYETPHIDRLAASGARFTTAYSACTVCSPTRAALMTGLYPARLRVTDFIPGGTSRYPNRPLLEPAWTQYLDHAHTTFPEILQTRGYRTAHVGKWHLTPKLPHPLDRAWWPEHHGFDLNIAGQEWGQPGSYFFPYQRPSLVMWNMPPGKEGDYLTDRLTDEAIAILTAWRDRPFLLYLPYYTVHTPLQAKPEKVAYFQRKIAAAPGPLRHRNPTYAAMVSHLDDNIGRLLDTLDQLGLTDSTAILLTGDNGGLDTGDQRPTTNNDPLRAGKGTAYEGGVRVPLLARVPGLTSPGLVLDPPVITMDLAATALDLARAPLPPDLEGRSLLPLFSSGPTVWPERDLFWHYPHYHSQGADPYSAIRSGSWRLLEFHHGPRVELYDLAADPAETTDLAATRPEIAAGLRARLHAWRASVGAQMPAPNPAHDPAKPAREPFR